MLFRTRPSTVSSTPSLVAPATAPGVIIFLRPSANVAIEVARVQVRLRLSLTGDLYQSDPKRPMTARHQGTGKLMCFSKYGQAVLTLHERRSRLLIAVKRPNKKAEPIAQAMSDILASLPPQYRQTVTFDNGTEFAQHYRLHDLNTQTFFCDTYSPWQKGGVENAIGRMRRSLPRKTDLAKLSEDRFVELVQAYNNTPRKCLDYRTPAELFWKELLHFKCESIRPHPPG